MTGRFCPYSVVGEAHERGLGTFAGTAHMGGHVHGDQGQPQDPARLVVLRCARTVLERTAVGGECPHAVRIPQKTAAAGHTRLGADLAGAPRRTRLHPRR